VLGCYSDEMVDRDVFGVGENLGRFKNRPGNAQRKLSVLSAEGLHKNEIEEVGLIPRRCILDRGRCFVYVSATTFIPG
jgi:hypothetical protein